MITLDNHGKMIYTMANYDPHFSMTDDEATKTRLQMAWDKFQVKNKLLAYYRENAERLRQETADAERELVDLQIKIKENPQP